MYADRHTQCPETKRLHTASHRVFQLYLLKKTRKKQNKNKAKCLLFREIYIVSCELYSCVIGRCESAHYRFLDVCDLVLIRSCPDRTCRSLISLYYGYGSLLQSALITWYQVPKAVQMVRWCHLFLYNVPCFFMLNILHGRFRRSWHVLCISSGWQVFTRALKTERKRLWRAAPASQAPFRRLNAFSEGDVVLVMNGRSHLLKGLMWN